MGGCQRWGVGVSEMGKGGQEVHSIMIIVKNTVLYI